MPEIQYVENFQNSWHMQTSHAEPHDHHHIFSPRHIIMIYEINKVIERPSVELKVVSSIPSSS